MTEKISNKELSGRLMYINVLGAEPDEADYENHDLVILAAERLAAMPDTGEQEPAAWLVKDGKVFVNSSRVFLDELEANQSARYRFDDAKVVPLYTRPQQPAPDKRATDIIGSLLDYAWRQTCTHEETHRGGLLWEICDSCGAKWADDEGGRPEWETPKAIRDAEVYLAKIREGELPTEAPDKDAIKRYCVDFFKFASNWPDAGCKYLESSLDSVFDEWLQQSAEGGE